MTEAEWQDSIVEEAQLRGWMVAHFRRAIVRAGRVATPVAYDAAGYPDLTLVHPKHGVLFVEVKSARGRLSEDQRRWHERLRAAGARVEVWRPRDVLQASDVLRGLD